MERSNPDIAKWKAIIRNHLGKVCVKSAIQILLDMLSVDVGLKPAYLFDVACVCGEKLQGFIEELRREEMLRNKLLVLVVQDDVFVIHPHICDILQTLLDDVVMVDVSDSLPEPVLLPADNIKKITSMILKQLQRITNHPESNILTLSFPTQVDIPTVFGYLLGYPILYWSAVDSNENCLGMVPLLNFKLQFKNVLNDTSFEYTCFSFSVPKSVYLAHKFNTYIDVWYAQVKANCSGIFENPVLSKSEIVLPCVAM